MGDDNTNNLIVVYNEKTPGKLVADQLKKLVSQNSDELEVDIEVIPMEEKVYIDNSKANPLIDKVLFVDGVKYIEDLKSISEIKFHKYGVIYSLAGPQAVLTVNTSKLKDEKIYNSFLEELNELTYQGIKKAPRGIKGVKNNVIHGLLGYLKNLKDIKKQQLIYGATVFFNNDLVSFMK